MTGLPARRIQLAASSKPDVDWTARLALGGAAAFTLLLFSFGLILYESWPQVSGVHASIARLNDRTERIANGQESLSRDIASLSTDLRQDRTDRTEGSREVAVLRARVGELAATIKSLREQTDKLEEGGRPVAASPARAAQPDPAVAELRGRLDALQQKLDQLVAAPAVNVPAVATAPQPPSALTDAAVVKPAIVRPPAYPVDEIDREVRDMQSVIQQQQYARATVARKATESIPPGSAAAPRPSLPAAGSRPSNGIADPLAPIISKTPPRIAPSTIGDRTMTAPTTGPVLTPTVSRVPSEPFAQQTVKPGAQPAVGATPEPRVSRVGVNSAIKTLGPLGIPFDAIGNLFTAIGEGLDHLITGREYIPRPTNDDEPTTARAAR